MCVGFGLPHKASFNFCVIIMHWNTLEFQCMTPCVSCNGILQLYPKWDYLRTALGPLLGLEQSLKRGLNA